MSPICAANVSICAAATNVAAADRHTARAEKKLLLVILAILVILSD